jgi:hypothetical protein
LGSIYADKFVQRTYSAAKNPDTTKYWWGSLCDRISGNNAKYVAENSMGDIILEFFDPDYYRI